MVIKFGEKNVTKRHIYIFTQHIKYNLFNRIEK